VKPKRTQERSQKTRQEIFENALELFREKGFEATTMRDIAERSEMAVGASYYYFKSKDELVTTYYLELEDASEVEAARLIQASKSLRERIQGVVIFKIQQLQKDRRLVQVLARVAGDPRSPLSPFAIESRDIRDRAIAMIESLIDGSDVKVGEELRPSLAKLLWLYYLGMIFLWAHDRSAERTRTKTVLGHSLTLIEKVLWLSTLPLTGTINRTVRALVDAIYETTNDPAEEGS